MSKISKYLFVFRFVALLTLKSKKIILTHDMNDLGHIKLRSRQEERWITEIPLIITSNAFHSSHFGQNYTKGCIENKYLILLHSNHVKSLSLLKLNVFLLMVTIVRVSWIKWTNIFKERIEFHRLD